MNLFGKTIYIDVNCVADGEPVLVTRSWRERWCSRPWTPWRATRWETPKIPAAIELQESFIMHPAYFEQLKREVGHLLK